MNRIKEVIKTKGLQGFETLRPSDEVLSRIGVNIKTWNKWVENKKDPELSQLPLIAEFLNCKVTDLIHQEPIGHGD